LAIKKHKKSSGADEASIALIGARQVYVAAVENFVPLCGHKFIRLA
jgi:hypothetical protein